MVLNKILAESVHEHGAKKNIGWECYWLRVFRNMVLKKILAKSVQEHGAKENTGLKGSGTWC